MNNRLYFICNIYCFGIISLVLSQTILQSQSLNIFIELRPTYGKAIRLHDVKNKTKLDEILSNYPHSWIDSYESTQISKFTKELSITESGKNNNLTKEQIAIINKLSIGDKIQFIVNYNFRNSIHNKIEKRKLDIQYTVIPDNEAKNDLEMNELKEYLFNHSILNLPAGIRNKEINTIVKFIVDTDGSIKNIELKKSSGIKEVDQSIINVIQFMPPWTASSNNDGEKFKQEFELAISNTGGC